MEGTATDTLNRFHVGVRIRPKLKEEAESKEMNSFQCLYVEAPIGKKLRIVRPTTNEPKVFGLDYVLSPAISQETAYHFIAEDIINEVLEGYNGTILAYGQTGSGKSYTTFGPASSLDNAAKGYLDPNAGIVFRGLHHLFEMIKSTMKRNVQFQVTVSFLQIYMENITDLLHSHARRAKEHLSIREDPQSGLFVEGLCQKTVRSLAETVSLVREGIRHRITAYTPTNPQSSRSHAVLQLFVEQRYMEMDDDLPKFQDAADPYPSPKKQVTKRALLTFVDLAGSERLSKANEGLKTEEAKAINKSISILGNCIFALANESKRQRANPFGLNSHIPFRDSKLTRLLSESLSGNSKTAICTCVTPSWLNFEESLSTLLFAQRAMTVRVTASINQEVISREKEELDFVKATMAADMSHSPSRPMKMTSNVSNYEKPFMISGESPGGALPNDVESLWKRREKELVTKYTQVIEHLQNQLARKNLKIAQLEGRLGVQGSPR